MLGWKAEEQRRFFHLRGKPISEREQENNRETNRDDSSK